MWPHDASHARLSPPSLGLWTVVPFTVAAEVFEHIGNGLASSPPTAAQGLHWPQD